MFDKRQFLSYLLVPVKKTTRNILALVLTLMYSVIMLSPLAPLALHSKAFAHAVTGECTGDCDTCGCAPERRATRTCCCFLKKQKEQQAREENEKQVSQCCKTKPAKKKVVTLSCNCPCGSGKQLAFSAATKTELLPNQSTILIPPPRENLRYYNPRQQLASRYDEPPDPPPKLSLPDIGIL